MSTPDDPDRSVDAYRAASDALDEQPSAATRAAILAAAARAVQATPRDAAAPLELTPLADAPAAAALAPQPNVHALLAPTRPSAARAPRTESSASVHELPVARRRARWPLAAAAAVLVASLAVLLAVRTDEETAPSFTAPPEMVARAPAAPAAPAAPLPPTVPTAVEPAAVPPAARAEAAAAPSAAPTAPAAAPAAPAAAPAAPAAAPTPAAAPATDNRVAAPAEAPRERGELAGVLSKQAAVAASESADAGAGPAAAAAATTAEAPATAARDAAAARAPLGAAAPRAARSELPDDWIAHIIELRRAGRDAEAEAELRRFRERYPHIPVPSAALPRTGTR
jgi:hypothetical protein